MNGLKKIGLIIVGYISAALLGFAAVSILPKGPDSQGGMRAFGDLLFFLAVFGVAAVFPSGVALYWLRGNRTFWKVTAAGAILLSATAAVSATVFLAEKMSGTVFFGSWSNLAILRILVAPLFGIAFLLAGLLAPERRFRLTFFVTLLVETLSFGAVAFTWIPRS